MRTVPLRRHLIVVAVASVLPLALLAGVGLVWFYAEQREGERHRALEVTRAIAISVDGELDRSVSALEVVAADPVFGSGDRAAIDAVVRRALTTQPRWATIVVADARGNPIVDTDVPFGEPIPPDPARGEVEQGLRTGQPQIGGLTQGPAGFRFAIRVPVRRDSETNYVVSARIPPAPILVLIDEQRVPADWVVSVFDRGGMRIARSRAHERYVGQRGTPSLQQLMSSPDREGTGRTVTIEGDTVYSAYHRLTDSGWTVAVGMPSAAAAVQSSALYLFAVATSLLVGLGVSLVLARRIDDAMSSLRHAARALGRGGAVDPPHTSVLEIQRVGDALADAAAIRNRIEGEREELLDRERAARSDAETANRAKDHFLAMLGHELRNPLSAMSSAALLLERTADPEVATRARGVIARQVAHLGRLTDDLLDVSRVVLGKIELRREPVDLAAVAGQVLGTLERTGRTAGHRIEADLQPAWVCGDPVRLDQITTNLLVNAVKYTPTGGSIRVVTRSDRVESVLTVVDTGIGMGPDLSRRVFDLFVQGERAIDRADGGLGIGLTLVRRLAELHGGHATATSAGPQQGSTFEIRLPAAAAGSAEEVTASPAGPRRRVLVVEDNADAREALRVLLETLGHQVDVAGDGLRGLELALASEPEVLLVDLGLPGIDGFELARRYRATGPHPGLLVALTGYGGADDRVRTRDAGFDVHVTKPLDFEVLAELLRR